MRSMWSSLVLVLPRSRSGARDVAIDDPGEYDLYVVQGATFRRTITWSTGATVVNGVVTVPGTPVDLTDYTAKLQIRKTIKALDVLYESTDVGGDNPQDQIVLGGAAGTVEIVIDPASSSSWMTWRRGRFDLELYAPGGGDKDRLLMGNVFVSPEVTRP